MGTFQIIKTGEIKQAYSIETREGKVLVKFTKNGKIYSYAESSVKIMENKEMFIDESQLLVYSLERICYNCGQKTEILTYLVYDDGAWENLVYPWDKERLNSLKSAELEMCHFMDPEIEYYPIMVIGRNKGYDKLMSLKYPTRIKRLYSKTEKRRYAMNICQHCRAGQGENYIYRMINETVKKMVDLPVVDKLSLEDL